MPCGNESGKALAIPQQFHGPPFPRRGRRYMFWPGMWMGAMYCMLVIQTSRAKRLNKYAKFMAIVVLLTGSFGALLTLHWYTPPPEK